MWGGTRVCLSEGGGVADGVGGGGWCDVTDGVVVKMMYVHWCCIDDQHVCTCW